MAGKKWVEEFRNELVDDHKALLEAQERRKPSGRWSFDVALSRTQAFYRERLTGFARCGSINTAELKMLLELVDHMGTHEFKAEFTA